MASSGDPDVARLLAGESPAVPLVDSIAMTEGGAEGMLAVALVLRWRSESSILRDASSSFCRSHSACLQRSIRKSQHNNNVTGNVRGVKKRRGGGFGV